MTVASPCVRSGDHVCGFYYGDDERDAMLLPFLRDGLQAGDPCLAVVDSLTPEAVVAQIAASVDAHGAVASGQLTLHTSDATYLKSGQFAPEEMIAYWEGQAASSPVPPGDGFARVAGEMSWLERVPTTRENVLRYETWADGFAVRFRHAILCLYDARRVGSAVMLDLMCTHPKLLVGGVVIENPQYHPQTRLATA